MQGICMLLKLFATSVQISLGATLKVQDEHTLKAL